MNNEIDSDKMTCLYCGKLFPMNELCSLSGASPFCIPCANEVETKLYETDFGPDVADDSDSE
jgi:hypothetical protein